jgi:hypothetical protein
MNTDREANVRTANRLNGMATGVLFLSFFGGVWFCIAMFVRGAVDARAGIAIGLGFAVLAGGAVHAMRAARHWPREPEDPTIGRKFGWINAGQWAAGFIAYNLLVRFGLGEYFPSVLTAVVGLHFLPLAKLFHSPAHYATGSLMLAWSAVTVMFVPMEHLPSVTAFGTGMILWQAAATALALVLATVLGPVPNQSAV